MDASRNFSSPTFDYIIGNGKNLPDPTPEEFAHLLDSLGQQLSSGDLIDHVVGNRRVFGDDAQEVWPLQWGLKNMTHSYTHQLRARRIHTSERLHNGLEQIIYLGYDRSRVVWFCVFRGEEFGGKHNSEVFEITVDTASRVFVGSEPFGGKFSGFVMLHALITIMRAEIDRRRRRLIILERGTDLVSGLVDRYGDTLGDPVVSDDVNELGYDRSQEED